MKKILLLSLVIVLIMPLESARADCQGICGDTNADGSVNLSDAIWLINYIFVGGPPPQPVLACGDANTDGVAAMQDVVWIINFVFVSGAQPGDCSPGNWESVGGDCCPF
ncbi:MAG TPA: hypothetical protein ENO22_01580 [candidate division Zixibacteria bacterium]|mgnify:CR=1 FL=1|nr:hypothetical protein [candidate division Zixibacteria bacterium]